MIDPIAEVTVAVVAKDEKRARGTAFFLGPDVALTCSHVIRPIVGQTIQLVPTPAEGGGTEITFEELPRVTVIEVDEDERLDLALLRVSGEHQRNWLPLSVEWSLGLEVFSRGYHRPVSAYPGGDAVSGTVVGSGPVNYRGQQTQLLTLRDIAAEPGLSGAPLVAVTPGHNHVVVGIVRLQARDDRAHAIPARSISGRWPALVPTKDRADFLPVSHFKDLVKSAGPSLSGWPKFEPKRMQCVAVESEAGRADQPSFGKVLKSAVSNGADRIWTAFQEYWADSRLLLDGTARTAPSAPDIATASFSALEAYSRYANLDAAVRLVVEADVGLFDVTNFEPGIMLLLGIRAAARRGVTIVSHGGGWYLGNPLQRPFNLADLSIASHSWEGKADPDPREGVLLDWIERGYAKLSRQPRYLDTPVYESIRNLGPDFRTWSPVDIATEVLMLCPYSADYWPIWLDLRDPLRDALRSKLGLAARPKVARLQDLPSPQLVSQSLYERVRRCDGCVGDWTFSSPSTFFEIGVRLAISPKGVVQVAERQWLESASSTELEQIEGMRALFSPLEYDARHDSGDTFDANIADRIASQLVEATSDLESTGHPLRSTVVDAVSRTEQRLPTVYDSLVDAADSFHHSRRQSDERNAGTQALFSDLTDVKVDYERAAVDRRLAAWLYLEYGIRAGDSTDEKLVARWRDLGRSVALALYEVNLELALRIEDRIGQ